MRKRVPFLATYVEEVRAPRLLDLKVRYKLESSVQKAASMKLAATELDWNAVETHWQSERAQSLLFLESALIGNPTSSL
jgi:hypothetical protein